MNGTIALWILYNHDWQPNDIHIQSKQPLNFQIIMSLKLNKKIRLESYWITAKFFNFAGVLSIK